VARRCTEPEVLVRNAQFQQWSALLTNRTKRSRSGEFLIQGVRPVTMAVRAGWPMAAILHPIGRSLSSWATDILARADPAAPRIAVASDLLTELGQKEDPPEILAVGLVADDDLQRLRADAGFLGLVLDRPTSPGNIGTLVRSAEALGATAVLVVGHAADPYDPVAVRASTGSLFAVAVVRQPSAQTVLDWVQVERERGADLRILGTDEHGDAPLDGPAIGHRPALLVVGNETRGMSRAWHEACDQTLSIPMLGATASSLNAAVAGSIALYEAARRRP
jgi:23S rRNA (uridine2479-2'-O)-methyltransferase